ncbi:MAG: alpha/beta fold hydrolase [Candidatus Baltobacteraceae bacterium]
MPPLIPRETLFGNPENESARLSPDGLMLAYLAPHNEKLSVWVRTLGERDDRVVAHDARRPIHWVAWQGDSQHVLYLQDTDGDENYHLFRVDLRGSAPEELTRGENLRCGPLARDHRFPDELLVQMNVRDARFFDVYRIDFKRGESLIDTENPGDVMPDGWLADNAYVVRAAVARLADGLACIRVRDDAHSPWRVLDNFSFGDGLPQLLAFSAENRSLYVNTAKDGNASRLLCYDLASGSSSVVFEDPEYDVASIYIDPNTREIVAVSVLKERLVWHVLQPYFEPVFAALREIRHGEFRVEGTSADGMTLVVRYSSDAAPEHFYTYERTTGRSELLFCSQPALLQHMLAPMQPISLAARDGLKLHGYLTLPVGIEPRNLPTVLYVHGGPWHRDRWRYESVVQWLANRGYAVLQVNFRGSTGYGKAFLNAGDRQWAGAMRTDLLDARDWAVREGFADPERFGIFGGSYGGYAVLAALTSTPDVFTCGVDLCGPSNLNTFMEAIPSYWEPLRKMLAERVGEDPEFLDSQSPIFKAASIRVPLLVGQGANDPRVRQQESDQIVAVLRGNGIPVQYVVFEDEGHEFANPANIARFTALAEAFLAETLGGRFESLHAGEEIEAFLR